ncbi:unnamed protein product [Ostreobium quekettii]|uniref:Uncharacterized protein n=1 Tax=Ostreobium quekettii TaxID=121088 RepID=A0A8S1J0T8_9CHLO|nr:unnamed protein product [Ostreobium quekettii]
MGRAMGYYDSNMSGPSEQGPMLYLAMHWASRQAECRSFSDPNKWHCGVRDGISCGGWNWPQALFAGCCSLRWKLPVGLCAAIGKACRQGGGQVWHVALVTCDPRVQTWSNISVD